MWIMQRKETVLELPFWRSRSAAECPQQAGAQIENDAINKVNYYKPFMWSIIAAGCLVFLWSLFRVPAQVFDRRFLFLSLVTVFVGSRIGIGFSRHKIQITVSDTLVFLTFLLFGCEAAVLVAAAEAFYSSFRFSNLWRTRLFNSALLATVTFLSGSFVTLVFGPPTEMLSEAFTSKLLAAVFVLAGCQYLSNSIIAAIRESLKTAQPLWSTWKDHYLWVSVTYFAGASAAGITAILIIGSGFYAFVASIPLIGVIYFTYRSHYKQLEAKTQQVEQAARYAAEQQSINRVLRQSQEHFRGAFDHAAVGMALVGIDGRWLRVNQSFCSLVGYSEDELLKLDLQSITHPEDLGDCLAEIARLVERNVVTITAEKRYVHKRGHEIWTTISASLVTDLNGEPQHFIMQAQDISERKLLEERFLQSQKLESVGRLAGGIAHDFNNMLTVINGYSEVVLRRLPADDPTRQYVSEIKKAGERSALLTNQLLAFSRKQVLNLEPIRINDVIRDMGNMLQRLIGEDVELVSVLDPAVGNISFDRGQLSQIIMNLAVNARDAMPDGGELTIETSTVFLDADSVGKHVGVLPGPYVLLAVTDTGTGIEDEQLGHIFEPFYTTKEIGKGTGLGLATVYGIVKQSGGSIFATSEVGNGTTFKIFLPRVSDESVNTVHSEDTPVRFALGNETILLVEDDEAVRGLTRQILESCGYSVIRARDGHEALELFGKHKARVDLLLTDVMMPNVDGRELALKLLQQMPDLPVLFVSGYVDSKAGDSRVLDGNVDFAQKPFSADDLSRKVRDLLDRGRTELKTRSSRRLNSTKTLKSVHPKKLARIQ
jgi:PAS domain S-box-containing protein